MTRYFDAMISCFLRFCAFQLFAAGVACAQGEGVKNSDGALEREGDLSGWVVEVSVEPKDLERLHGELKGRGRESEVPCAVQFLSGKSLLWEERAGIRLQGATSRLNSPKPNYRIIFRKTYGKKILKERVFGGLGPTEFDSLILRTPSDDSWLSPQGVFRKQARYVNDLWMNETLTELGYPTQRSQWVRLLINGESRGLYSLMEEPNRDFMAFHYGGDSADYDIVESQRVKTGDDVILRRLKAMVSSPRMSHAVTLKAVEQYLDLDHFNDYFIACEKGSGRDLLHKLNGGE